MDQSEAPLLDALVAYHQRDELPFTPPGHKQGRGTDPRVLAALGDAVFRSDVLATAGLDDRTSSAGLLKQAEELMADVVGARHTFFTTCGSSLSVKAAMLAVSGPGEELLISRDAHKSVTSCLILAGIRPVWGTTSPSVLIYAALDGWRRQMAEHGHGLLDAALRLAWDTRARIGQIAGLHVYGEEEFIGGGRAAQMDPLQLITDVSGLGVTGYRAADWLRAHHHLDLHVSDHRRASAQLSYADDQQTTARLVAALADLADHAADLSPAAKVEVPDPADLRLELAHLPRDAFFAPVSCWLREMPGGLLWLAVTAGPGRRRAGRRRRSG